MTFHEFYAIQLQGKLFEHEPVKEGFHLLRIKSDPPNQFSKCSLNKGGATMHGGRTLHYAFGNKTDKPRRGYIGYKYNL